MVIISSNQNIRCSSLGNWMPYGMSPTTQIAAWRKLSVAVRAQTNMTGLLWSPNIGGGYPYRNGGMFVDS
jgi:hypothetical protein